MLAGYCVWELGMHFALSRVEVQYLSLAAHLYEGQILIGVFAVTACCEPVLQSSNEQLGMIVSSLLLQDPGSAPIALFHSNYLGMVWTVCWWLINYFPKDLVASTHGLLPVRLVTKVLTPDSSALRMTCSG